MGKYRGLAPGASLCAWAAFFGVAIVGSGLEAGAVRAETLADAIALAYESSPTLQQQRSQLRALNETYVQARAGWRPTANLQIAGYYSKTPQSNGFGGTVQAENNSGQATLGVTQPIYTGGRIAAEVRATEADVLAGRQSLRITEANVLQNVVSTYLAVLLDQELLSIHEHDVAVLQGEVDDSRARFKAGESTATDLAQIETQLAQSRTALTEAQGQLQIDRANYANVVGQNPGHLETPPTMPGLPADVDAAFDLAEKNSPTLLQAQITEEASRARVSAARSALRPTLSVNANISMSGQLVPFTDSLYSRGVTAQATITQPLFAGGTNASTIRQALALNTSDRIGIETARRTAVQAVSQGWNQMITDRASIVSEEEHVRVARDYFAGTQAEYTVGQRQALDIVIAEQSLVNAEITLAEVRRDAYVAQAAVLNAVGRLEARYIVPDAPHYDPAVDFRRVAHVGSVPWEGLVAAVDNLGAPAPDADKAIFAPPVDLHPVIPTSPDPVGAHPAPATASPTAPLPRTTSPSTPDTLGADVGAPQDPARPDRTTP
jgi:outer membrane protein